MTRTALAGDLHGSPPWYSRATFAGHAATPQVHWGLGHPGLIPSTPRFIGGSLTSPRFRTWLDARER